MSFLTELREELRKQGDPWIAEENEITALSEEDFLKLVVDDTITNVASTRDTIMMRDITPTFDLEVDWRNRNGHNYISPSKTQSYGDCICFASIGMMEAMLHIEHDLDINLSEADLFCCSYGTIPGIAPVSTQGMPWIHQIFLNVGACTEEMFPYPANSSGLSCVIDPDRDANSYTISGYNWYGYTQQDLVKAHICNVGPVIAAFNIYQDFGFITPDSVYTHVYGDITAAHAVAIIGYSEVGQYWICKNSWGAAWNGGTGCFKIAYGTAEIDSYSKLGVFGTKPYVNTKLINATDTVIIETNPAQYENKFIRTKSNNNDNWTVSTNPAWLTAAKVVTDNDARSLLRTHVTDNITTCARYGTITITHGDVVEDIILKQLPPPIY